MSETVPPSPDSGSGASSGASSQTIRITLPPKPSVISAKRETVRLTVAQVVPAEAVPAKQATVRLVGTNTSALAPGSGVQAPAGGVAIPQSSVGLTPAPVVGRPTVPVLAPAAPIAPSMGIPSAAPTQGEPAGAGASVTFPAPAP
ncbi:MAG: hypothetical protein RIS92_3150, partial [Verrucomicrobiota bacterium]